MSAITKSWPAGATLASLVGVLICLLIILAALKTYVPHQPLSLDQEARVLGCQTRVQKLLGQENDDTQQLGKINDLCFQQIEQEDGLTDSAIRRLAYLNQQEQLPVLMWMVVAITLSGVALSGLQLLAAYRLALLGRTPFEQGGQLTVDSTKASISSSVTGLIMLLISLAFFYVFVTQVYKIEDVHVVFSPSGSALGLGPGGLNRPARVPAATDPGMKPAPR